MAERRVRRNGVVVGDPQHSAATTAASAGPTYLHRTRAASTASGAAAATTHRRHPQKKQRSRAAVAAPPDYGSKMPAQPVAGCELKVARIPSPRGSPSIGQPQTGDTFAAPFSPRGRNGHGAALPHEFAGVWP
jgi:hypothetical protein